MFSLGSDNVGLGKLIQFARKLQASNSNIYSSLNFLSHNHVSSNEGQLWEEAEEKKGRKHSSRSTKRDRKYEKTVSRSPQFKQDSHENPKKIVTGFIGYEYECVRQHRFILDPTMDSLLQMMDSGDLHLPTASWEAKRNFILSSNLPLYFPCVECLRSNEEPVSNAQLQRIFLVTPNISSLVKIHPTIQFISPELGGNFTSNSTTSQAQKKSTFDMLNTTVSLPSNSFLCLCLPYSYYDQNSPTSKIPSFIQTPSKENSSYSNSVLLKGSIFPFSFKQ